VERNLRVSKPTKIPFESPPKIKLKSITHQSILKDRERKNLPPHFMTSHLRFLYYTIPYHSILYVMPSLRRSPITLTIPPPQKIAPCHHYRRRHYINTIVVYVYIYNNVTKLSSKPILNPNNNPQNNSSNSSSSSKYIHTLPLHGPALRVYFTHACVNTYIHTHTHTYI
jgi:hypothetical protein